MKLQTNLSGAWRDVIAFKPERLKDVQGAALSLAYSAARPKFRIDRGPSRPALYLDHTIGRWAPLRAAR